MTEEQAIKVLCMIETHDGLAFKAKEIAIKDIRDMEKIREIIECDANAEIKLKMISNIVHSKPHYFKTPEQELLEVDCRKCINLQNNGCIPYGNDANIAVKKCADDYFEAYVTYEELEKCEKENEK